MTLQEQKNCPMISSKATVASWNSLHWSCKPLIRLRKILASRSLEKGGRRALARRVGIARPCVDPHPPRPANGRLGDLPFSRLRDSRVLPSICSSIADRDSGELVPADAHRLWTGWLVVAIPSSEAGDDPGEP